MLLLADRTLSALTAEQLELASAFANAAAAALAQLRVVEEHERQVARQSALTRAAKTLHESLELETLLSRICDEAAAILDGDIAIVYRGTEEDGLRVAAAAGCPPEMLGFRLEPGSGLAGRALAAGRPVLTNHYRETEQLSPASPFDRFDAARPCPSTGARGCRACCRSATAGPTGSPRTTSCCSRPSASSLPWPAATPA